MDYPPVLYRIIPIDPCAHLFEVICTITDPDPAGQRFSLPTWIPGSYLIREFAKHVVETEATAGERVLVNKIDKSTWVCAPCRGPLTLRYQVYACDLSVRGAHLDTIHGFFNGTSVFVQVRGQEHRPCVIDIDPPAGAQYARWRVASALARAGAQPYGFGRYRAQDYDELVDHPVEMGEFALASFEAGGIPHDVVITGRHRADLTRLTRDLEALCRTEIGLFGEAPMARYVFLVTALGEGYGGLEHRASTCLICGRDALPRPGRPEMSEAYREFLGLCSHEYFHAWNVKRIRPQAFVPYDLSREAYTRQLWAFEGITSYYDDLLLLRAGLISIDDYLELLGHTITRLLRTPGRQRQSVAESSFDAWIKFYRQDENAPNAIVSYYTKGALIALALDLTLRRGTNNRISLDDVMRALWQRYGRTGQGVPEGGVERAAHDVSGLDLASFFATALHGTDDLPLVELFAAFGIDMALRPAESDADKGGKRSSRDEAVGAQRAVLGLRLVEGQEARIAHTLTGGAAQAAGLSAGDVIIAVDGLKANRGNLEKLLEGYVPDDVVRVHAFRRDELMTFDVCLRAPAHDTCVLSLSDASDPASRDRRRCWIGA